jgi:hypothetical protein
MGVSRCLCIAATLSTRGAALPLLSGRSAASIGQSDSERNRRQPCHSNRLERYNTVSMICCSPDAVRCPKPVKSELAVVHLRCPLFSLKSGQSATRRQCPLGAMNKHDPLFYHLVSAAEKRRWHREAHCLGGLEVDDHLEFGRKLHR